MAKHFRVENRLGEGSQWHITVCAGMEERDRIFEKVASVIRESGRSSYIGEDDFVSLTKGTIRIDFHLKNANLDVENIFRTVKRAEMIIAEKFLHQMTKINISIFDSRTELSERAHAKSQYASWIAGIYDGAIKIVAGSDDEDIDSLYIILTHEITHQAVSEISRGRCPYWLDEGLAVHLSQRLPDVYVEAVKSAVAQDAVLPIEFLERPLPDDIDENTRRLAYGQCAGLAAYVLEFYDWPVVREVLESCAVRSIPDVLRGFATNYYLLEQGWKRSVRTGNYG